jgi:hypothetical protein
LAPFPEEADNLPLAPALMQIYGGNALPWRGMVAEPSCDDRLLQFPGCRTKRGAVVADTYGDFVFPREIADLVRLAARDKASVGLNGFCLVVSHDFDPLLCCLFDVA